MSALDRLIPRPLSRPLAQPLNLRPLLIAAFSVIAIIGVLQVVQTSDATTTGYSLRDLDRQRADKLADIHQLEAEIAALTSIERVESEARGRLGMAPAEDVITLEVHEQPPEQQPLPERFLRGARGLAPAENDSLAERLLRLLPFY